MFKDKINMSTGLEADGVELKYIDVVTNRGVQTAASMLGSPYNTQEWMPFVAIGDGETPPSTEDVTLENELYRKRGTVTVVNNTYFIEATFGADEPQGDIVICEIGLFNAYSGGDMGARWVLDPDYYVIKYDTDTKVIRCSITLT